MCVFLLGGVKEVTVMSFLNIWTTLKILQSCSAETCLPEMNKC